MDRAYRYILAENDEESLNLAPLAKTDGIAELAIMAAARGSLVDREHAIFAEQIFCDSDAAAAGDIKQLFQAHDPLRRKYNSPRGRLHKEEIAANPCGYWWTDGLPSPADARPGRWRNRGMRGMGR